MANIRFSGASGNKPLPATINNMGYRTYGNNGSRIKRRSNSSGSARQERTA